MMRMVAGRIARLFTRQRKPIQNRPLRLMHVLDVLALAGMEYGVIKLVNRLDLERFSPMICCLRFQLEATRSLLDKRIPVFELGKRPGRDLHIIFTLAALLRRERIDIVHSHNWPTFFYTLMAAAVARVPIMIHGEHGLDDPVIPRRQLFLSRWLTRWVSHLVTVSVDLSRQLVEQWQVKPERVSAIANGVNLETFGQDYSLVPLRQELCLTPANRVVLNIGGLRPIKDHPTLLRAFARVYQKLPQARLLLVGSDHGTGIQANLEELAKALGIREAIHFIGIRHDVPQLLALCDVYVNTSLFEGMSNTILEAMAARKPVVATAVGGNPELVHDGVTGYLVSPGNDQQLAERLAQLVADTALLETMGTAGRTQVERDHPMSRMVQVYGDLYQETFWRHRLKKASSLKEQVKGWTAYGLRWSGLYSLRKMARPTQLTILTYHRVLPLHEALQYPFQAMVMPRDLFEAQMAHLARHYTVLGFPEAVCLLQKEQLPRRAVVVTFDDGYRDNYEYAWPILKKYGIPATFFLVSGVLDGTVRLWWDEVAEDIQQLSRHPLFCGEKEHGLPDWMASLLKGLHNGGNPQVIAQEMSRCLNYLSLQERQQSLAALRAFANVASNQRSDLMLTWEQIQELHHSGIHIGAHTVTHTFLDELDEERGWQEIEGSIKRIQERLEVPVHLFAYPAGRFKESLKSLLHKAGIEAAVLSEPGRNKPGTDLLQLKRLDAGYCRLSGSFDPAIFEAELQGWFNLLR